MVFVSRATFTAIFLLFLSVSPAVVHPLLITSCYLDFIPYLLMCAGRCLLARMDICSLY